METIQVVLDKELLRVTGRYGSAIEEEVVLRWCATHCANTFGDSRSSALEGRDREGYSRKPQVPDEARDWEAKAVWPLE